jgi:hypothetical protein
MTKKTTPILIAVILLLLVAGGLYFNSLKYELNLSQTALGKERQETKRWIDKEGKSRAEIQTISASQDVIKSVYESEIDSLRKSISDIGRNGRNLNEATTISTETRDSLILKTVFDTVVVNNEIKVNETLKYSDKWLDLEYFPSNQSLTYASRDSLSIVKYEKKQGFLKPRITSIQVINHNPRSSVTGIRQFEITPKSKRFDFGLQAGYGFTNNGMSPYVGIGFTIRLLKR